MSDFAIGFGSHISLSKEEPIRSRRTGDSHVALSTTDDAAASRSCPLLSADEAIWLKVVALKSGDRFRKRLGELGIQPGSDIRIVCRSSGGPLVIALGGVGESRIALGAGMAAKITVVPSEDFRKEGPSRQ